MRRYFKESKERKVSLSEDDHDLFLRLVYWLYTGQVDARNGSIITVDEEVEEAPDDDQELDGPNHSEGEDDDNLSLGSRAPSPSSENNELPNRGANALFRLWILADKLCMPKLQNAVAHKIVDVTSSGPAHRQTFPDSETINFVYDNTLETSPLRSLAIDTVLLTCGELKVDDWIDELPVEALQDLSWSAITYWQQETHNHDPKHTHIAKARHCYDVSPGLVDPPLEIPPCRGQCHCANDRQGVSGGSWENQYFG